VTRLSSRELIAQLADEGSFESWDEPIDRSGYDGSYIASLAKAAERAGTDESVITGRITVGGRVLAVIASEFAFLAGSIGQASASRIVAAIRRSTDEGLPLLGLTASGGTRMQEGTPAFVRMVDIARALTEHRRAKLAYLAYLRHPTTGGVFATWGSLAHFTWAEPAALVGFLGPKVYEQLYGRPFPGGVQQAEHLAESGVIDGVVEPGALRAVVADVLSVLVDGPSDPRLPRRPEPVGPFLPPWSAVELTRRPERAGVRDVIAAAADVFVELSGTDEGERDPAIVLGLARCDGQPCVLVGQDRSIQSASGPFGPAGLRVARRGMRLAEELGIPLVTIIDTAGAELSQAAEEGAIAGEIARCLATLSSLSAPSVSVLLGEGSGGGALALLPAQTVLATQNAWLTPLPPEGASVIVYGDTAHAPELVVSQKVSAPELRDAGIVHRLIAEQPEQPDEGFAAAVGAEIAAALSEVRS
jgi:acyl-CoA carboxylase subunit beta